MMMRCQQRRLRKTRHQSRRKTRQVRCLDSKKRRCLQEVIIYMWTRPRKWEKHCRANTVGLGKIHHVCGQLKKVFAFDSCECHYHVVCEIQKMKNMSKQNSEINFKIHQPTKLTVSLAQKFFHGLSQEASYHEDVPAALVVWWWSFPFS